MNARAEQRGRVDCVSLNKATGVVANKGSDHTLRLRSVLSSLATSSPAHRLSLFNAAVTSACFNGAHVYFKKERDSERERERERGGFRLSVTLPHTDMLTPGHTQVVHKL